MHGCRSGIERPSKRRNSANWKYSAETDPTYDQIPVCAILFWQGEVQQKQQLSDWGSEMKFERLVFRCIDEARGEIIICTKAGVKCVELHGREIIAL